VTTPSTKAFADYAGNTVILRPSEPAKSDFENRARCYCSNPARSALTATLQYRTCARHKDMMGDMYTILTHSHFWFHRHIIHPAENQWPYFKGCNSAPDLVRTLSSFGGLSLHVITVNIFNISVNLEGIIVLRASKHITARLYMIIILKYATFLEMENPRDIWPLWIIATPQELENAVNYTHSLKDEPKSSLNLRQETLSEYPESVSKRQETSLLALTMIARATATTMVPTRRSRRREMSRRKRRSRQNRRMKSYCSLRLTQ
jgi:hypothetical protein